MRSVLLQWPFLTDISLGLAAASIFQVAPLPPGDVPDTAQAEAVQASAVRAQAFKLLMLLLLARSSALPCLLHLHISRKPVSRATARALSAATCLNWQPQASLL